MNPFPAIGFGQRPGDSADDILRRLQAQGAQRQQQVLQTLIQPQPQKQTGGGGLGDLASIAKLAMMFI
jgi:hypothetical protein